MRVCLCAPAMQVPSEIKYEAESPDEAALVVAAKVGGRVGQRDRVSMRVRGAGPSRGAGA